MTDASVDVSVNDGVAVLRPSGEFDIATASTLGDALADVCTAGLDVVLDLGDVAFMDAAAMGHIAGAAARLTDAGCRLEVVRARGLHRRLFEVLGLSQLLAV